MDHMTEQEFSSVTTLQPAHGGGQTGGCGGQTGGVWPQPQLRGSNSCTLAAAAAVEEEAASGSTGTAGEDGTAMASSGTSRGLAPGTGTARTCTLSWAAPA